MVKWAGLQGYFSNAISASSNNYLLIIETKVIRIKKKFTVKYT